MTRNAHWMYVMHDAGSRTAATITVVAGPDMIDVTSVIVNKETQDTRPIQKSPSGVCVSPYWSLARRESPGIEGVPPSNEGKMPSIPALPARSSPPVPTFEEPRDIIPDCPHEQLDCPVNSRAGERQSDGE